MNRLPNLLLLLLLAGHLTWLAGHVEPAYSSPDASGYFVQARLLATEGRTGFRPASPVQYTGIHWLRTADGDYESRYPAGLPALLALSIRVGGVPAALWVNPALATLTLLFVFLLVRAWTSAWLGLVAALVLAVHPLANQLALHADSHTAGTAFLTAGLWLLDRWARTRGLVAALAAGLVLGAVPTIRYPEAITAAGVALFLLSQLGRDPSAWRGVLAMCVAAALPVGALLAHNQAVFGGVWKTGYALTGEQTGFSWADFVRHALPYLEALAGQVGGLCFGLGLCGIGWMLADESRRPTGLLLLGVALPLTLLYMAYYFGGAGGMNLRFFLPTVPVYVCAGAWVLGQLVERHRAAWAGVLMLLAVHCLWGVPESRERMAGEAAGAATAAAVVRWAEGNIPAGSVVMADRRVLDALDYPGCWRLVDAALVSGPGGRGEGGPPEGVLPGRPSPMQPGKNRDLVERYAGLGRGARALQLSRDILGFAGRGRAIYWLAQAGDEVERFVQDLDEMESFSRVGEIELPRPSVADVAGPAGPGGLRAGRGRGPGPGGGNQFAIRNDGRPLPVYRWDR